MCGFSGDSRAVLCRGGVALDLTNDQRADRQDEAVGALLGWVRTLLLLALGLQKGVVGTHAWAASHAVPNTICAMRCAPSFPFSFCDHMWVIIDAFTGLQPQNWNACLCVAGPD